MTRLSKERSSSPAAATGSVRGGRPAANGPHQSTGRGGATILGHSSCFHMWFHTEHFGSNSSLSTGNPSSKVRKSATSFTRPSRASSPTLVRCLHMKCPPTVPFLPSPSLHPLQCRDDCGSELACAIQRDSTRIPRPRAHNSM